MNSPEIYVPITAHTVVPFPCWLRTYPNREWIHFHIGRPIMYKDGCRLQSMWFDAYCLSDTLPTEAPGGEPTVKESLSVEPPPPVKEEATSGDFLGYGEPIGSVVEIYPYSTGRERLARSFFDRELFTYFSELSSGQTGWGICYNGWLKIHGWELIGFATFKRVQSVEEEIATSALPPPDGEPTDAQMLDWLQKMGRGVIALVSADGHPDFSADFEGMIYSTNKSIRAAIASPSPRQREETK